MSKHLKRSTPPRTELLNTFQAASYLARVTRDYERNFHELLRSNRRPLLTKAGEQSKLQRSSVRCAIRVGEGAGSALV